MNNNRWKIIFLMICFNNTVSSSFGQSIEELYGLNFPQWDCFQRVIPYLRTLDSTQMREDGSYLLRLEYKNNYKGKKTGIPMVLSSDCRLIFSRTILLPPPAKKEERIVVSLNCKTEIDSLRFLVTARDKYENILFIDSLIIQPTHPFINYSISFTRSETRTVTIMIGREGCHETLNQKSIYFDKITIHRGEEDLNTFPITSLVKKKDLRLKTKAIIPLSSQTESTLKKIHDWKDKKLIALGESIYGLQDLMEIQIQMLKHLILWENCRLVIMDMSQNQCVRWKLYLQGKEPDSYKEELLNELSKTVHSPVVFLEFLQWVRDYNTSAADAVRIIGITNGKSIDYSCMSDYLWKLSTNLQDSMFYSKALK